MKSTLNYEQLRPPPKANFIIIARRLTYCIIDTLLLRFSLLRNYSSRLMSNNVTNKISECWLAASASND